MQQISQGQLQDSVWKEGRLWKIDPAMADLERAKLVEPRRARPELVVGEGEESLSLDYMAAKTRVENIKAEREHLNLLEQKRVMLRADAMARIQFELGRLLRDSILAVPELVGPSVTAGTDLKQNVIIMKEALTRALEELVQKNAG